MKSQEINLDYILELIFENNKKVKDKVALVDEVRRVIRASLGNRAKESLMVDFINQTDLDELGDKASVIEAFFRFAQAEQQREAEELIEAEKPERGGGQTLYRDVAQARICQRKRHRAQCHPAQDESAQSAIPDQKAERVPEDRSVR